MAKSAEGAHPDKGQTKKSGNNKKTGKAPDTVLRLEHLYKVAHCINNETKTSRAHAKKVLSSHYGGLIVGVAKKAVLRPSPDLKRTICKGCRSVLQGKVRFDKTRGLIVAQCPQCRTEKRFPLKKKS